MVGGFAALLLFQLAGEVISSAFALPVPGPVIGMVMLFLALLARGHSPKTLDAASEGLLKHFSLFFIPAGTGVIAYLTLIRQEWLPITVSLIGSTVITIAVTAVTMQALIGRRSGLSPVRETEREGQRHE